MASQYISYSSRSGGGGGGGGTVAGPMSSTTGALAVWANTSGTLLENSNILFSSNQLGLASDSTGTAPTFTIQGANETGTNANGGSIALLAGSGNGTGSSGQIIIPQGALTGGGAAYLPSLAFSGDLTTGLIYLSSNAGIEKGLALVVNNSPLLQMGLNNASQTFIDIGASSVYPDHSVMPASFGKAGNEWANMFTNLLTLGNQAGSGGRTEYIAMQGWQYVGIGCDDTNGNNWYFNGWDTTTRRYFEMLDIFQNNSRTSIYPGADSSNTAAQGLLLRGSNNSSTGPGGDTTITAGTSTGGAIGNVVVQAASGAALATTATSGFLYIPTCAGVPTGTPSTTYTGTAPMVVDTTDSKLYIYIGGAWKGTVLA